MSATPEHGREVQERPLSKSPVSLLREPAAPGAQGRGVVVGGWEVGAVWPRGWPHACTVPSPKGQPPHTSLGSTARDAVGSHERTQHSQSNTKLPVVPSHEGSTLLSLPV